MIISLFPDLNPTGLSLTRVWDDGSSLTGICVGIGPSGLLWCADDADVASDAERPPCRWFERSELTATLADSSTRDRAARWLAERVGQVVGATAPKWERRIWGRDEPRAWCLGGRYSWTASILGGGHIVTSLASIDLADPHADWLALAAVCRHVGGAP